MKKKDAKKIKVKLEIETLGCDDEALANFTVSKIRYILAMAKAQFNVIHTKAEFVIYEGEYDYDSKKHAKGVLHES